VGGKDVQKGVREASLLPENDQKGWEIQKKQSKKKNKKNKKRKKKFKGCCRAAAVLKDSKENKSRGRMLDKFGGEVPVLSNQEPTWPEPCAVTVKR